MNPKVSLILILAKLQTCWSASVGLMIKDLKLPRDNVISAFAWLEEKEAIKKKSSYQSNNGIEYIYDVNQKIVSSMLEHIEI